MKGGHRQSNSLHDLDWDAFVHATHAPQFRSCNYYVCVCVCVRERERERETSITYHSVNTRRIQTGESVFCIVVPLLKQTNNIMYTRTYNIMTTTH